MYSDQSVPNLLFTDFKYYVEDRSFHQISPARDDEKSFKVSERLQGIEAAGMKHGRSMRHVGVKDGITASSSGIAI